MHSQKNDTVEKISNFLKHFLTSKLRVSCSVSWFLRVKMSKAGKLKAAQQTMSFCVPPASSEKAQKKEIPRLTWKETLSEGQTVLYPLSAAFRSGTDFWVRWGHCCKVRSCIQRSRLAWALVQGSDRVRHLCHAVEVKSTNAPREGKMSPCSIM